MSGGLSDLGGSFDLTSRLLPKAFVEPFKKDENFVLEHVSIIIRHGLRTPNDRLLNDNTVWECGSRNMLLASFHEQGPLHNSSLGINQFYQRKAIVTEKDSHLRGNCEHGQLTYKGFAQHLKLGSLLRERYVEQAGFLPQIYKNDGSVFVRSSNMERTFESVQALLNGLYPAGMLSCVLL